MAKKLTAAKPLLKAGRHLDTTLMSIEEIESQLGDGYRWHFEPPGGAAEAVKTTSTKLRVGGALAKWLESLRGTPIVADEEFDIDELIGCSYELLIGADGQITKVTPVK